MCTSESDRTKFAYSYVRDHPNTGDEVFSSGFAHTDVALMVLNESQGHPLDI